MPGSSRCTAAPVASPSTIEESVTDAVRVGAGGEPTTSSRCRSPAWGSETTLTYPCSNVADHVSEPVNSRPESRETPPPSTCTLCEVERSSTAIVTGPGASRVTAAPVASTSESPSAPTVARSTDCCVAAGAAPPSARRTRRPTSLRTRRTLGSAYALVNFFARERIGLPIRFQLPASALDRVAFVYSPLLEAALSLHVLVRPKHHPLQHAWVRAMRRLDPGLKRTIDGFSFLYGRILADCFLPPDADRYLGFDEELERLRALDEATLAYELTRPLHDHGGAEPREAHLDDPEVRAAVLESAALLGPDSAQAAAELIADPRAAADRLADLLEAYWDAAFGAEWERLEPLLADAVTDSGRVVAEHGIYALLLELPPVLRVDTSREEFGLDVPHDHAVEIDADRTLVLVPSYYVWPHVRVNCDAPWPLTLVYPAPFVQGAARRQLPPAELVRVLRAAGDATRLQALRLIAASPRSTQELAPLIGISEAGLSKHLRVLAEAGLVRSRREGYYVLYSLVPERVRELAAAVPAFLEPPLTG